MQSGGCAGAPSRPPFTAERCFRTVLISEIRAPHRSSISLTVCLSCSVISPAGSVSNAEPPPETRHNTKSSLERSSTTARIFFAAARPAASGIGCEALEDLYLFTRLGKPVSANHHTSRVPSQCVSTAAAIAADALPAPITKGTAYRRGRQIRWHTERRLSNCNGCVEQRSQKAPWVFHSLS